MTHDPYLIPGTQTLRNLLGITDKAELDRRERLIVTHRTIFDPPGGDFDLRHLQDIHRHLFQDIYEWAGELRTVDLSKEKSNFMPVSHLATGIGYVQTRLAKNNYLKNRPARSFAEEAAVAIGDINHVHPFREGNGRTQMLFLKQLTEHAGHSFKPEKLDRDVWIQASKAANETDYNLMATAIYNQLNPASRRALAPTVEMPPLRNTRSKPQAYER